MMNDEELNNRIEQLCEEFKGQMPNLCLMVGVVVVGRLFGWRVMRLTVSRGIWTKVMRTFGDPKEWMPERGRLAHKSQGLKLVDRLGDYWEFINGAQARDGLSARDRKALT